jgi:isopenicillin-N epimerase
MQDPHQIGSAFWKNEFLLRPDIHFLNFGSFGACPKVIFEDYQNWQRLLEQEPVQFIAIEGPRMLAESRAALASYVHCDADDLVYVTNPTYAVNIVAKSLNLREGDEILTTDLEYGACDKTWDFYCAKTGATYVRRSVVLPLIDEESFIEDFLNGITAKSKLVFISHLTSTTGLRLPVEKLIPKIQELGIPVFVDGAHAPGHIRLDLQQLGADYYTGACHKWMMTAKGSSFLYVRKLLQSGLEPLLVSWGYKSAKPSSSAFIDQHQMQGTRDFSAFLTIPKALDYMSEHQWPQMSKICHELALTKGQELCEHLNTPPLAPLQPTYYGQMFSCPIVTTQPEKLQRILFEKYRIEIPVMAHGPSVYLRFSVQVFNHPQEYDYLIETIGQLVGLGMLKGA